MREENLEEGRRPLVSVIIPYYQRKRGVLAGCVRSVLDQEGAFDLQVVVTDDSSPIPADEEIGLIVKSDSRVRIVRQPNGGAGAARNKSLDNVNQESDYIALMDSDDQWKASFLDNAVRALENGFDLFFADSKRYSQEKSRFNWELEQELNLRAEDHLLIDADFDLYEYRGDFFDFAVRRSSIMGPSSMVYRRSVAPVLRFSPRLRNGQDRLFKLHLCRRLRRVAFSPRILCTEGEGVNIFDSASWGTQDALLLSSSYIDLAKSILREVALDETQKKYIEKQLRSARRDFCASIRHLLLRRKQFDWKLVARTFRRDPPALAMFFRS